MHRHFARLSTRTVRYLESGSGTPLVFVHGFPFSAEQWLPQLARVPAGWRFVAPDMRGFGGHPPEPTIDGPITIDTYAADLAEFMAHLDMANAVVCGLSMGGYVAMALAKRAPKRIAGLVLADTRATADSDETRSARDRMLQRLADAGPAAVADDMLPKLLGPISAREQPDLIDVVRRVIESNHPEGIAAAIRAMKDRPDSIDVLSSLGCPALIVVGGDDVIAPLDEAEAMHQALQGSQLTVLPSVGHMSNLEAPAAFNALLADWLHTALGV
jgi:3-oxoadipate enol-lactonase